MWLQVLPEFLTCLLVILRQILSFSRALVNLAANKSPPLQSIHIPYPQMPCPIQDSDLPQVSSQHALLQSALPQPEGGGLAEPSLVTQIGV